MTRDRLHHQGISMSNSKQLLAHILAENHAKAVDTFNDLMENIVQRKLVEMKKRIAAEFSNEDYLSEAANIQRAGRTNIVRSRIRNGQVQRRRKVSAVPGWTVRDGKLVRMTSKERMNRRMAQRRAKVKRKNKLSTFRRKLKVALRKRKTLGVD